MKLKKALSIYEVKQEIEQIRNSLAYIKEISESIEATDFMKAMEYTGMPKAQSYSNAAPFEKDAIKRADLTGKLQSRLQQKTKELASLIEQFESFLDGVEDSRDRVIIRYRCTDHKTWEEIGEIMNMERTTASKRFYKYFDDTNKIPTIPA